MIPPFLERSFELLKSTALASSLAYSELLYQAMQINSQTYRPPEVYSLIAVMYFTLLLIISGAASCLNDALPSPTHVNERTTMHYQWDFSLVWQNLPVLLKGLGVTLELWLLAGIVGTLLGLAVGVVRSRGPRFLSPYQHLCRGVPQYAGAYPAHLVLLCLSGAGGHSVFHFWRRRAGVNPVYRRLQHRDFSRRATVYRTRAVGRGKALGMPPGVMLRRIILPQVFRRMLPALTNRMIELAKVTSTASILTVNELMYQGRLLSSTRYRPVEIFTVVALLYFVLIWPGSYGGTTGAPLPSTSLI